MTATVNPDVLLTAEWSAALYLIVLVLRRGPRPRLVASLAAVCAASALTHGRGLPLLVPAALAVAIAFVRERRFGRLSPVGIVLAVNAVYVAGVVVAAGWGRGSVRQFGSYVLAGAGVPARTVQGALLTGAQMFQVASAVGGGVGGFYLASSLGYSKGITGSYLAGFMIFASLCFIATVGLGLVKTRWRTTWGALANARVDHGDAKLRHGATPRARSGTRQGDVVNAAGLSRAAF